MSNDDIKFCKDCVHVRGTEENAMCAHPDTGTISLVTGQRARIYAAAARSSGGGCERGGKLWEAAPKMPGMDHVPGR